MGLFKKASEKRKLKTLRQDFKIIQAYSPVFTSYSGGLYEMGLIRSAIDTIATQCSKLNPVITANRNYNKIKNILQYKPNKIMTSQQFLYKLVTILCCENNAFIIPLYKNDFDNEIVGFYPARGAGSRIVVKDNIEYLVYKVGDSEYAIEYDRVGHLRKHFYKKEYSGESNEALQPTADLIHTQEEGIKEGIKSGATIRFLARLNVIQNEESIKKEQKRLKDEQLSIENNGGVLIFDNKYADVKQVDSKPFIVDEDQMNTIKDNVYAYYHVSEEIIKNTASEDQWNLFYEAVIEPLAIQISQVLTNMILKEQDILHGDNIVLESTKLQFINNNTKLQVSQQLFDRGILSVNQVMDIWNLPRVPEEDDKRYIRKEYTEVINLDKEVVDDGNNQSTNKKDGGDFNGTGEVFDNTEKNEND